MGRLALRPRVVDYLEVQGPGQKRLRLEEIIVDAKSPLVGHSVGEACGQALPLLLRRESEDLIPNPDRGTQIVDGDLLLVLGEPSELRVVEGD